MPGRSVHFMEEDPLGYPGAGRVGIGDEMDLMAASRERQPELGRHRAGPAVCRITRDADLHFASESRLHHLRRATSAGGRVASRSAPAAQLVTEPGFLPLGVLAGARRDRLRDGIPFPLSVEYSTASRTPTPSSPGVPGRVASREHGGDFFDQAALQHLSRAA